MCWPSSRCANTNAFNIDGSADKQVNSLHAWQFFIFCCVLATFIRVSKSLDPDQDRHSVGPDLGPNCLQRP